MIRFEPDHAPIMPPVAPHPVVVFDHFAGPGRHADPVCALRADLDDIAAVKGAVLEDDLVLRGWSIDAIIAHLGDARRLGREAVER